MKALKNPATWLAILALQGCSTATTTPENVALDPIASLDVPQSIQPQTFIIRGQAVVGHETRTFTPCGSQQQFWLDMSPEQTQQALQLARQPYQPMYGEFIGYLAAPSQTGYNADYAARFIVKQVNILTAENPNRCDQDVRSTRAFGTEPAWSINFKKDQLEFSRMGQDKQQLNIESSRVTNTRRHYQFNDGELTLEQGACSDNMSDSIYGWTSTLDLGDTHYSGCATLSNQDSTTEWSGLYFASSTKNVGFSVELQLNPDHSATTTYRYTGEDLPTVEQGFWQQLNNNQIQVVMTRHQQQYLVSERIFKRDGYQLVAEKEKVGNVVYPIANGGLTLFKSMPEQTHFAPQNHTKPDTVQSAKNIESRDQFNPQVDKAIRDYFAMHKTEPSNTQYRWLTHDLNGDGKEELLAQIDWCTEDGCTLLIFENHNDQWRFNSRIPEVNSALTLGSMQQHGWHDLLFSINHDQDRQYKLSYSGISYPSHPSLTSVPEHGAVTLFSDQVSPQTSGVKL